MNIIINRIDSTINLFFNGQSKNINFDSIEQAKTFHKQIANLKSRIKEAKEINDTELLTELEQEFLDIWSPSNKICEIEGISVDENNNFYLGDSKIPIPQVLISKIIEYIELDIDISPLINFWNLLLLNPDESGVIRQSLPKFAEEFKFPITDKGYFIAYKSVLNKGEALSKLATLVMEKLFYFKGKRVKPENVLVIELNKTKNIHFIEVKTTDLNTKSNTDSNLSTSNNTTALSSLSTTTSNSNFNDFASELVEEYLEQEKIIEKYLEDYRESSFIREDLTIEEIDLIESLDGEEREKYMEKNDIEEDFGVDDYTDYEDEYDEYDEEDNEYDEDENEDDYEPEYSEDNDIPYYYRVKEVKSKTLPEYTFLGNLEEVYQSIQNYLDKEESQFTDIHTRTFDIKLGQVVSMPRNECDYNPSNTCSKGLHVGAPEYVSKFGGSNSYILACLVSPMDVVAVPEDYSFQKLRTCKYYPYALCELDENGMIKEAESPYFEEQYTSIESEELSKLIAEYNSQEQQYLEEEALQRKELLNNRLNIIS